MTIITQDEELINYNAIKRITSFAGEIEDEGETVNAYGILAFDMFSETTNTVDVASTDGVMQLGIYNNEAECQSAMNLLIASIERNALVFRMPQPKL